MTTLEWDEFARLTNLAMARAFQDDGMALAESGDPRGIGLWMCGVGWEQEERARAIVEAFRRLHG